MYASAHGAFLSELHKITDAWFKQKMKQTWKHGSIIDEGSQPRSYIIKGDVIGMHRRNRYHIRPSKLKKLCPV